MKVLKVVTISITFFLYILSCEESSLKNLSYKEKLAKLDSNLTDHFPNNIPKDHYLYYVLSVFDSNYNACFWPDYLLLEGRLNNTEYSNLKNNIKNNAIAIYHGDSEDMILLAMYCDYSYKLSEYQYLLDIIDNNNNCDNCYPVMSFFELFDDKYRNKTYYGLDYNFTMYILDAKPGIYLDKKYLPKKFEILPDEWEHGYSRGVAMNDSTFEVFYWVAVW